MDTTLSSPKDSRLSFNDSCLSVASHVESSLADDVSSLCGSIHGDCKEMEGVQCRLETKELWDKFHDLGTEMIITKSGRYEPEYMLQHLLLTPSFGQDVMTQHGLLGG